MKANHFWQYVKFTSFFQFSTESEQNIQFRCIVRRPHLPLTDDRWKFFVPTNPTHNYENIYIWWHEIIKINLVSQALFEKTYFSVILYYKIDHFCSLNAIFTHFLPFDPMFGSGIHYYLVAINCWYI